MSWKKRRTMHVLGNVFLAFGGLGTADDELYEALGVGEGAEGCEYAPQDDGELEVRRSGTGGGEHFC